MTVDDYFSTLPQEWRKRLRGFHIEPIERGMSEAKLFHLRDRTGNKLFLKIWLAPQLSESRNEVERTKWLARRRVRVPTFIRVFEDKSLAAILMTALPGHHPQDAPKPRSVLIRNLAQGLFRLHSISSVDCPFDETIRVRLRRAREMIRHGHITPECFSERNQGISAELIYSRLKQCIPDHEDLVLVHGDATFDNLLIDDDGSIGFIDCGHAGRGDRYLDLSSTLQDIQEHYGSDAIAAFARSYNRLNLDPRKLDFFRDLYELF